MWASGKEGREVEGNDEVALRESDILQRMDERRFGWEGRCVREEARRV